MIINEHLLQAIYNYLLTKPMMEVRDLVQGIEAEVKAKEQPEIIKSLSDKRTEAK